MSATEDQDRGDGATDAEPQASTLTEVEKLKSAIKAMAKKLLEVKYRVKASKGAIYVSSAALNNGEESEAGDEFAQVLGAAYQNLSDVGDYVDECLEIVTENDLDYWTMRLPAWTGPSEQTPDETNAGQAEAEPEGTEDRAAHTQLQEQLEGLQHNVNDAVTKLSAAQFGIDEVTAYLSTGTQALRKGEDDGVRDVWRVLCDGYVKLLDVSSTLDDALNALDPSGAKARKEAREREFL